MTEEKQGLNHISKENHRDYLFDNLRAVLIILVVLGHMLTVMLDQDNIIKSVYVFIYFFHMPAMVFVSGYFSKNLEKSRSKAFLTILLPYIIINIIYYCYNFIIIGEPYHSFRFFRPSWGLWYLLALFAWKFMLKDLVKIRYVLPLSIVFAFISGFSNEFSAYMSLGRIVNFLPFFLLGYYSTKDHVKKIRKIPKTISLAILGLTGVLSGYIVMSDFIEKESFYMRKPYPDGLELKSMIGRILIYVIALLMIAAVINLTTAKKTFLSNIGTRTLTVYVLHLFAVPLLDKIEIFRNQPYLYLVYAIVMTVILVFVFTRTTVKHRYDAIMSFFIKIIIKEQPSVTQTKDQMESTKVLESNEKSV